MNNDLNKFILEKNKKVKFIAKNKNEITIRSSAAEYLTYVAVVRDDSDSIEVRYEDNELTEDSTIRNF